MSAAALVSSFTDETRWLVLLQLSVSSLVLTVARCRPIAQVQLCCFELLQLHSYSKPITGVVLWHVSSGVCRCATCVALWPMSAGVDV
jgi:hypothetical protein